MNLTNRLCCHHLAFKRSHVSQNPPSSTARLTISYRSPTPLHTELILEGELVRTEGRKNFCAGRMLANGVVTAEAEGLFVAIDVSKFEKLLAQRERRESERK